MRLHGQAQADQMRMRSLIQSGIAEATGRVDALDSSLSAVAKSGEYADLSGKPTLGALASLDSITTTKISNWTSATSGFLTAASLAPYAKTADLGDLAALDTIPHSRISDWTSATSSFLTAHQDISGLLAKAGGTMSGTLIFDTDLAIRMSSRDGMLVVCGGNGAGASAGAKLSLYGRDHASAGGFILQAGNSSGYKQLKGDADGSLSWGNSPVVTNASLAPVEVAVTDAEYVAFAPLKVWRSGNVVTVYAYFTTPASVATSWTTAATGLPKPLQQIKTVAGNWSSSYARPVAVSVESDGTMKMVYGKASTKYSTTFSYVASES